MMLTPRGVASGLLEIVPLNVPKPAPANRRLRLLARVATPAIGPFTVSEAPALAARVVSDPPVAIDIGPLIVLFPSVARIVAVVLLRGLNAIDPKLRVTPLPTSSRPVPVA